MKRELPPIIKKVGFDFRWDERKVWTLDIPTEEMPIEGLVWHFDVPFWSKSGGFYDLKPKEVMNSPEIYIEEYRRAPNAETSRPIDVMYWKGRWVILDGLHRLVKHASQGLKRVMVRKIPEAVIPLIQRDV